jgi:integrase
MAFNIECPTEASTAMLDWLTKQVPKLNISAGTRRRYDVLLRRLEQFDKLKSWDDLTVENLYEFDAWLHQITKAQSNGDRQAKDEPQKIGDSAVYNYHRTLKSLLNRAVKMNIIASNPYERLKGEFSRGVKESVEYLTEEEIAAVESLQPMKGTQVAMARDLFVFQLYTGLSYSDAQAFDISEYKNVNGRWINTGERIKTGVPYVSQLLPQAVEVLERYNWQVPQINNMQYNASLKDIQKALGIRTRLHSHLARHTFATRMLAMGVKIENVSRMLGHSNITMTQRYAKVLAESVHEDFDMIAKKLTQNKNL